MAWWKIVLIVAVVVLIVLGIVLFVLWQISLHSVVDKGGMVNPDAENRDGR